MKVRTTHQVYQVISAMQMHLNLQVQFLDDFCHVVAHIGTNVFHTEQHFLKILLP